MLWWGVGRRGLGGGVGGQCEGVRGVEMYGRGVGDERGSDVLGRWTLEVFKENRTSL